jgi:hypothetical protein
MSFPLSGKVMDQLVGCHSETMFKQTGSPLSAKIQRLSNQSSLNSELEVTSQGTGRKALVKFYQKKFL